jgi:hypothetical protein
MLLGFLIVVLAVVTGSLGWNFALVSGYNRIWAIIVVAMFIVWLGIAGLRWMLSKKKEDAIEDYDEEEYKRRIAEAQSQAYHMQNLQPQGGQEHAGNHAPQDGESHYPSVAIPKSY